MDTPALSTAPALAPAPPQRAFGRLRVAFNRRGEETVLAVLRQEGCFKARQPRPEPGGIPETVLLNTSGGITGGDDLAARIEAEDGTHFVVTTQAAERYYKASPASPPATIRSDLRVEDGALLEWLPQETILFDRCRVDRTLSVDLAPGARFLGVESLIFGRQAMGETVDEISLRDRIIIRHGGKLILHDATRLEGEVATLMARASTFADARAMATIVAVRPDAGDFVEPLRAALGQGLLPDHSLEAGVSAWNGLVLARLLATDGATLRRAVMAALDILRAGAPLPRVWQL
ncbi:urease accessory protein UreD [Acidisoma cellulosilytica]|uniref:Urease accessory protein UreD n=1 Tax=Acidisoma cellulosilyticum TaxID=2802395 RepID=A0A963YXR3_9PROT|nr:urease accessory protein UreD [Acidisoma cellulosilyticum]MCB8878890.1 urease accessory protein UreD [Acidisoma cellulosilyticum]